MFSILNNWPKKAKGMDLASLFLRPKAVKLSWENEKKKNLLVNKINVWRMLGNRALNRKFRMQAKEKLT